MEVWNLVIIGNICYWNFRKRHFLLQLWYCQILTVNLVWSRFQKGRSGWNNGSGQAHTRRQTAFPVVMNIAVQRMASSMNYLLGAIGSSYEQMCVCVCFNTRFAERAAAHGSVLRQSISRRFIINSLAQQAYEHTLYSARNLQTRSRAAKASQRTTVLFFDRLRVLWLSPFPPHAHAMAENKM